MGDKTITKSVISKRLSLIHNIFTNRYDLQEFYAMHESLKNHFESGDGISYDLSEDIIQLIAIYGTGKIGNCNYCHTEKLLLGVNKIQKCFASECEHIVCNKCKERIWQNWNICDQCKRMFCRKCIKNE